jgi:hypothetical protein
VAAVCACQVLNVNVSKMSESVEHVQVPAHELPDLDGVVGDAEVLFAPCSITNTSDPVTKVVMAISEATGVPLLQLRCMPCVKACDESMYSAALLAKHNATVAPVLGAVDLSALAAVGRTRVVTYPIAYSITMDPALVRGLELFDLLASQPQLAALDIGSGLETNFLPLQLAVERALVSVYGRPTSGGVPSSDDELTTVMEPLLLADLPTPAQHGAAGDAMIGIFLPSYLLITFGMQLVRFLR